MEGIIKVSTEQLRSTASEFNGLGQQIGQLTTQMMETVTGLASVWEGAAAQAYIAKFRGLEDDIQRMVRMVAEHVSDLNDMAAQYDSADSKAGDLAGSLSSDVIV